MEGGVRERREIRKAAEKRSRNQRSGSTAADGTAAQRL